MSPISTRLRSRHLVHRLTRSVGSIRATTSDHLVLTFDDGPDPLQTHRILDVLNRHGATATFFVLLTRTRKHRSILADLVDTGHEVGLHGPDHRALSDFSYREAVERTVSARDELEQATGLAVRWFRPPYGSQSPSSYLATRRAGLTPVLWNATTWDWKAVSPQERVTKALEGGRPGSILLAHDGQADTDDGADDVAGPACDSAALMDELLHRFESKGLTGRSLGEALDTSRPLRTLRLSRRPIQGAAQSGEPT